MTASTTIDHVVDGLDTALSIAAFFVPAVGAARSALAEIKAAQHTDPVHHAEDSVLAAIANIVIVHGSDLKEAKTRASQFVAANATDQDRAMWARTKELDGG